MVSNAVHYIPSKVCHYHCGQNLPTCERMAHGQRRAAILQAVSLKLNKYLIYYDKQKFIYET